ncbi:hypothetical protein [Prescottella agglutinans]|uniref:Integrase n=1 Tax=Prescottella agglutinans TaxID=1644129 RepID=A0ABT6MHU8_9NOCA|nr:hypothetical protein [Prescottella agglutinans]MDH6283898.1 integrase [Prescottella agglutinans]
MTATRTPEEVIERYTPVMPVQLWESIGPFVRDVVRRGFTSSATPKVTGCRIGAVASIVAWAVDQGLPLDVEEIFHPATVDRYALSITGLSNATRSTRRATLTTLSRRITRAAPWEPERETLPYPRPSAPYTWAQAVRLCAWAPRQRSDVRRQGLSAALALGFGAGLRATEMITVTAADVRVRGDRVIVTVRGPRPRQVPVLAPYADAVVEAAERAGGGHVFRDPLPRVEYVSTVLNRCEIPDRLRPLTAARLRLTWEVAVVQAVPLPVFMTLAGLKNADSLNQVLTLIDERATRSWIRAGVDARNEARLW